MNECPRCSSRRVVEGKLGSDRDPAVFRPAGLRSFTVTEHGGPSLIAAGALACLDCGLVWNAAPAEKLREFVRKYCRERDSVPFGQCVNCQSNRLARGKIIPAHGSAIWPAVFQPAGRQAFTLTLGGPRFDGEALACLGCGWVWNSTSPEKLRSYIQKYCDRTPENAAAFEGCEPPTGWKEKWIGGIGVALLPFGYGIYCLYTGHALFLQGRRGAIHLQGSEAVIMAVAYIGLGACLHFRYFWGRHPRLRRWSPRLTQAALLVFIGGFGYMVLRHFF